MATSDLILSIVASEQGFLASILSAEVVKADTTARWVNIADVFISGQPINAIISLAVTVEDSVANVITAAADKEVAIAAKVAAVLGNPVGPIAWEPFPQPGSGSTGCTPSSCISC
jgi:hypothetical protein